MKTETLAAVPAAPVRPQRRLPFDPKDSGVLLGLIAIIVYLSLSTSTFLTASNLVNLLDQTVVIGLIAVGATLCIISGVFDLSASANLALSAIAGVYFTQVFGVGVGFILALLTGTLLGALTGTLIVLTRVHSFIGSLAMSIIYRGIAIVVTAGAIVAPKPEQLTEFRIWTTPFLGGITSATVLFAVALVVFGFLLWGTTFGRRIYAVGGNVEAARLSGVRTELIHVATFAISGLCAAGAGMVLASRAGSAQPAMATGIELTAIAAVVIGGTSIMGGAGAVWRTAVGVLILTVIANGFNLMGWDTTYQQVVTGALILVAVAADSLLLQRLRRS